jgi:hypothetical protein
LKKYQIGSAAQGIRVGSTEGKASVASPNIFNERAAERLHPPSHERRVRLLTVVS